LDLFSDRYGISRCGECHVVEGYGPYRPGKVALRFHFRVLSASNKWWVPHICPVLADVGFLGPGP
jgi:hypothetical protein